MYDFLIKTNPNSDSGLYNWACLLVMIYGPNVVTLEYDFWKVMIILLYLKSSFKDQFLYCHIVVMDIIGFRIEMSRNILVVANFGCN